MAHIFTPALRRPLSKPFAKSGTRTLIQRAISSLRARGIDAHLWLPGGDVRTYGPELVVNGGPFLNTDGWTDSGGGATSVSSGLLVVLNTTTLYGNAGLIVQTVAGKNYIFEGELAEVSSGQSTQMMIGTSQGNPTIANPTFSAPGTKTSMFVATTATTYITIFSGDAITGHSAKWSNISVREITSITPTILNGLTTGNYLESSGNTLATVDNPTGLVLDALGTVGVELVTNGANFVNTTGWNPSGDGLLSIAGVNLVVTNNSTLYGNAGFVMPTTANATYVITIRLASVSHGQATQVMIGTSQGNPDISNPQFAWVGEKTVQVKATSATTYVTLFSGDAISGHSAQWSLVSVREVTGIHLTQSTTANKCLLKQDAGSRYYWLFDATDLLTGTFPAGYESVTVIDAKSTGQVTTSAANVVGSYSIGPSYSSYGRIIIKGSITASELALYQGFANRLAGL